MDDFAGGSVKNVEVVVGGIGVVKVGVVCLANQSSRRAAAVCILTFLNWILHKSTGSGYAVPVCFYFFHEILLVPGRGFPNRHKGAVSGGRVPLEVVRRDGFQQIRWNSSALVILHLRYVARRYENTGYGAKKCAGRNSSVARRVSVTGGREIGPLIRLGAHSFCSR